MEKAGAALVYPRCTSYYPSIRQRRLPRQQVSPSRDLM